MTIGDVAFVITIIVLSAAVIIKIIKNKKKAQKQ